MNYYRDFPAPDQAPAALVECVREGVFENPVNVVWYLFVRIARDNPGLVRKYETAFRDWSEGRAVLLRILQESGDDQTKSEGLGQDASGLPHNSAMRVKCETERAKEFAVRAGQIPKPAVL